MHAFRTPRPGFTRLCASLSLVIPAFCALPALASSHREAPYITEQPKVDGTDFYMFNSYETGRTGYVTLVADYVPLQDAYGGPNYFALDPNAIYEIHINNDGSGKENLTFQFRFNNVDRKQAFSIGGNSVPIPLVVSGPGISSVADPKLNVLETYTVTLIRGDRRSGTRQPITNNAPVAGFSNTTFVKPVDNIGNKTIPNYAAYAAQHIFPIGIPGCSQPGRVFVGQRKDPFVVNLGETFDLVNIAAPATELSSGAESAAQDDLATANVTALELEVPASCLTNLSNHDPVIGGWTTASVRQARLVNPTPFDETDWTREGGAWTQVSRLGMPLVNEVVIGLPDKDKFNASEPVNDVGSFAKYVVTPTLPTLLQTLFQSEVAVVTAPTNYPRTDLIAAFLTGFKGVNQPLSVTPAEMLRLNTSTPPVAQATQNRLGVIGGDLAGFPNGRRPGDDVVDIELRVAMGVLCASTSTGTLVNTSVAAAGFPANCTPAAAPNGSVHYTDGAFLDASHTNAAFPYLRNPLPGSPQTNAVYTP